MGRFVLAGGVMAICLLFAAPPSAAQIGAATSGVSGTVKDESGALLPGVTVEASSPALIEKVRTTVTDSAGLYQIVGMPPATYSVTFTLPGFSVFKRDGLELGANFTATVNVELKVGALEETVTVSGASPLIDTQNVTNQRVISQALIQAVPTSRSILSMAALIPMAVIPASAQDVGGSKGEVSVRMSVHGSKPNDQRQMIDGMSYNSMFAGGTGRGFYANPLEFQDLVIDPGRAGSAEYSLGGAMVNAVPKDGGNHFTGIFFFAGTNHALQGDNLTEELQAQNLKSVNGIREQHDLNMSVGGPIIKDKLWFHTAHRFNGQTKRTANVFWNASPNPYLYVPDFTKPFDPADRIHSHTIRLTWQATAKDKINFFHDQQRNVADSQGVGDAGGTAREAVRPFCTQPALTQASWNRPQNNRLLFEGGISFLFSGYYSQGKDLFMSDFDPCPSGYSPDNISVNDQALPGIGSFTYGGEGLRQKAKILTSNSRFAASYVTGIHNFKAGIYVANSFYHRLVVDRTHTVNGLPVAYRLSNTNANQLTEFVGQTYEDYKLRPDLGLYVQDSWRLSQRLTVNLGLRYDYIRLYTPEIERPAGPLNDGGTLPRVDCLPCWHDLNPRLAGAYDISGDGKTVVKVGLNRYVQSTGANQGMVFGPSVSVVTSTTRSWTDSDKDFYPDCNLRSTAAQNLTATGGDVCGAMNNNAFGGVQIRNRPDQDWIKGYGKRPYDWQFSMSLDRMVTSNLAVNFGYFRTWFGNQTVVDNQYTTPENYDQYCITAPTDPRLPSDVSGQRLCGFYDVKEAQFGFIDNVTTLASKFGESIELYQGVDLNFMQRLPKGAQVSGGFSIGNGINVSNASQSSRSKNCYVVDSPQALRNCDINPPYRTQFKMSGSYPFPRDIQAAVVYQDLPGINYNATLTVPNAQIAPSLGRPLSGGTTSVSIPLLAPFTYFAEPRTRQLDFRVSKIFHLGGTKQLQGNVDIYNSLNASTVLAQTQTFTVPTATVANPWLTPTQVLEARLIKFSAQFTF